MSSRTGDTLSDAIEVIDLEEFLDANAIDYERVGRGENLKLTHCPFCGDDRNRVYFSTTKKRGICFHAECSKGAFNLFSFARAHWDSDNASTAKELIAFAGGRSVRPTAPAKPVCEAVEASLEFPASVPLPDASTPADAYLKARSVLPATQDAFGLRWCASGIWTYQDVKGGMKRMSFANRILLPVHDLDGTAVSFQGRDITGETDLRYLFPPSLPSSGRYLYGGHLALGAERLVVGEGPFDVIAIHQAITGLPEFKTAAAVGTFGLSISHTDEAGNDQLGRLLRLKALGAREVVFLWDGEANALKHALKAADLLHRHGFVVKIGLLPKDHDPGEVETRVIREAIERAETYSPQLQVVWGLQSPYR